MFALPNIFTKNTCIEIALNQATEKIMIVESNNTITYINSTLLQLFSDLENEVKKNCSDFDANKIQGQDIDSFLNTISKNEHSTRVCQTNKQGNHILQIGTHIINLIIKPLYNQYGRKLGTTLVWLDNSAMEEVEALKNSQAVIEFEMDGTILWANENFLSVMGYSLKEIQGQHHSMFADPSFAKSNEYKQFWDSLNRGQYQKAEYRRLGKNSKEVWIQASYNPIKDESGRPFKVVKYATEITEQKLLTADYQGQIEAIGKSQAVIEFHMDGTIITANENFLAVMGYSLEEIQGQHHSMFAEAGVKNSTEYKNFWETLNQGEYQQAEYRRIGKGGKEVWIQASYNPIKDMNGKPFKVVKYATDITRQKLQSADFRGQIEAIGKSQAVIEFNMDGTIITANQNFLSVMGYSLDEIQGQHHSMFAEHGLKNSEDYKQFWLALNRGEYKQGEYKRLGKNAKEVWIQASYNPIMDMNGNPFKVVKYATEITEQKQQTANYQGQIEAIHKSQAVIEFNMDGTIITANENFLSVMGYTLAEIQGQHHSMFAEPHFAKSNEYRKFWDSLNKGEFQQAEYKRLAKGGKEIWIQASYNPIKDVNGGFVKVVKYATDISEMVQVRQENELGVNESIQILTSISKGDLSRKMVEEYSGTFSQIKQAVNETINRLTDITSKMQIAANEVSSSAKEIAAGSNDLSQRTENQASSLQETSASMEQIAATVERNADNATQANELSLTSKSAAAEGSKVVENAVNAMNRIETSSRKISEITGVIDEIAFQINLLALNAAVEAARAGEAGKGFEVVAAEVRKLAQRSASAAKDIENLIQESTVEVQQGAQLVKETGHSLEKIVNSVTNLTSIVSEISHASREQAAGIGQVNKAVANMDGVTQQNSALVEQNSAASQSLQDRAEEVRALIEFFHINDHKQSNQKSPNLDKVYAIK